ncbi:MAG TPA: cytochrome P450, partial [Euzebya sp.]|nr:cytochrome P450 [Euzebya sp.]
GHETVSAGMSWVWYLLSLNPDVTERVAAEVDEVLGDRAPQPEDIPKLVYTGQVIDETMRLYPPLFVQPRTPLEPEVIRGYHIPAGSTFLALCPYVTHRHREFWDNPEGFDPDRFAPAKAKERHRFAYFPFGGGPRKCIGDQFALVQMKVITAMTLQRYRLDLAPGFPVTPQPAISLRPRHGLQMRIRDRERVPTAA